ncbi:MAG TPA: DUF58 domain-containing protein [Candidatus Nanoarchaeia archaeon]|nr:DUF58 domain-containing protein [Candidatus Nanoarchaeia archaeon]
MPETIEILKKVKKIEIKTKHLVDGLLSGAYHSVFRGRGIEFSEVREYVAGDDIRSIDWSVTARMNHPYVKEFIEERDLTIYIVLDVSASNDFGSEKSKKEAAIELSASLMFAALRNNDKVGLCLFTDKAEKYYSPRKGKTHILRLVRDMIEYNPKSKATGLAETLRFLSKVIKKRSIIFIISDFFTDSFEKELKILKNKHDVIAINMSDIRESEIPNVGYIELEDEETGEQLLLDTSDKEFRQSYISMMKERNDRLNNMLKKLKIDNIQLKSQEPYEIPLRKFFRLRERRMVR